MALSLYLIPNTLNLNRTNLKNLVFKSLMYWKTPPPIHFGVRLTVDLRHYPYICTANQQTRRPAVNAAIPLGISRPWVGSSFPLQTLIDFSSPRCARCSQRMGPPTSGRNRNSEVRVSLSFMDSQLSEA